MSAHTEHPEPLVHRSGIISSRILRSAARTRIRISLFYFFQMYTSWLNFSPIFFASDFPSPIRYPRHLVLCNFLLMSAALNLTGRISNLSQARLPSHAKTNQFSGSVGWLISGCTIDRGFECAFRIKLVTGSTPYLQTV